MVRRNRGELLLNTIIALALGVGLLACGWEALQRATSGDAQGVRSEFASMVNEARQDARSRQPLGTSIEVIPCCGGSGSEVILYAGLPDGRGLTVLRDRMFPKNGLSFGGQASFGIFFDEQGTASALAGWAGTSPITTPPLCTTPYTINETIPTGAFAMSLSCEEDSA